MFKKLWIVITTINTPTKAIYKYIDMCEKYGCKLLIVGDLKTPEVYAELSCAFLSIEKQRELFPHIFDHIPYNHYSRKNLGYLHAMKNGAEFIFDTDDDNIPMDDFLNKLFNSNSEYLIHGKFGYCNVYQFFTKEHVWPRGLPLNQVLNNICSKSHMNSYNSPIKQFLADKEPDVDAIYRLIINKSIDFDRSAPGVALEKFTWCPFNSQATLFHVSQFLSLYLPCYVPFRMTDIWRSFVAQVQLWNSNQLLTFHAPIVEQVRNLHNNFDDFIDEIEGYKINSTICSQLKELVYISSDQQSLFIRSYNILQSLNCIDQRDINIVNKWIKEYSSIIGNEA